MLPRILEPEVMDSAEEARDYDAMDHREVNERFVADFLRVWNHQEAILDIGTGTAQIPIALCRRVADARVTAVDQAEHMLELARRNVRRAGLEDRITLAQCDAKGLPYDDGAFGAAISNSIVHHIPEPIRVLREMVRVTQPGGLLFARDLLRPASESELRRLVDLYAGDANDHQRQMFAASLHAALTLAEMQQLVEKLGFPPQSVMQTSDRHWTWIVVKERLRADTGGK